MSKENWGRSYRIVIGRPEHIKSVYLSDGAVISAEELKIVNDIPQGIRANKKITVDATTIPAGKIAQLSNLASDDEDTRGFSFTMKSTRKVSANASSAEKTSIILFNLNKETIDIIQQEGAVVRVFAGYGGEVDLVYSGDVESVSIKHQGNDKLYIINCKDGLIDQKNTKVSLEYAETMSLLDIMKDLIRRFPSASVGEIASAVLEKKFITGGVSVQGNLLKIFEKMCKKYGLTYSRYNGSISVRPEQLIQGTPEYMLLANNNFILEADVLKNIEAVMDNKKKQTAQKNTKRGIQLNTFLIPITLSQFITIPEEASKLYAGTYKLTALNISLDSRKGPWDVNVTAEPM